MARKLKPHKIDEYRDHKSGRLIDIMFDRNTHDFFADVSGVEVRDETKKGCVQKVRVESDRQNQFEWKNVIHVRCDVGDRWNSVKSGAVALYFTRHRIAKRLDGRWNEHHCYFHYLEEGHEGGIHPMFGGGPSLKDYRGATESDPDKGVFVLPYSDEVWEGLCEVQRRIDVLRKQLQQLLGSDQVVPLLANLQQGFLPNQVTALIGEEE